MLAGVAVMGLLLAGVPLAALLGAGGGEARDDDPPPDDPPPEDAPDAAGDPVHPPRQDESEVERAPVDYEFVVAPGDHTIADFVAGTDTLTLSSRTWDVRIGAVASGADGSALEIAQGEALAVLRFPGHPTPPFADIFLRVSEDGADPVTVPLSEVLEPLDPDTPDTLPDPSPEPPLSSADPDAPDTPPEPGSDTDPLAPADPDAPEDPPQTQSTGATP